MTNHRRRGGLSLEQRAYRWIKRRQDVTAKECAKGLRVGYWAALQAIMRLYRKGCVVKRGHTYQRVYNATDRAPEDFRGTAEASLRALAPPAKPKRTVVIPEATTALEQAWGWGLLNFPNLPTNDAD